MEPSQIEASDDNRGWTKVSYRRRRKYVKRETPKPIHYAIIFAHSKESNMFKFVAVSRNAVGSLLSSTEIEETLDDRIRISTGLDLEYIGRYEFNRQTFYHIYVYNYELYVPFLESFRWMARGEIVDYRGIYEEMDILIPNRFPSWIQNNFPPMIQNWLHNVRTNYVVQGNCQEAIDYDKTQPEPHSRPELE
jgi:hypothetical protein